MMTGATRLAEELHRKNIPFERGVPLAPFTTFRIGGPAELLVRPRNYTQTAQAFELTQLLNVPYFFLGGGSNLLVSDYGIDGAVLHPDFPEEIQILEQNEQYLRARVPASARAPWTGKRLSELGYTGLEFLTTIPGNLGGSVIQNAGCYGWEIKDVLASITVLEKGEIREIPTAEAGFSYRNSRFKNDRSIIILAAEFKLPAGNPAEINSRIEEYKQRRLKSQPRNRRSAGSIFKNPPPEVSAEKAWQLIDRSGLRGTVIGDAEISTEHCNFIVNRGRATAADVYALIRLAEEKVFVVTGVRLEREVVLAGRFDEPGSAA